MNRKKHASFIEELKGLSAKEHFIFLFMSFALISFFVWDVAGDIAIENSIFHIFIDIFFGFAAALAIFLVAARMGSQRLHAAQVLAETNREKELVTAQANHLRSQVDQLLEGISEEINEAMDKWGLSSAEKEIGELLLKGLSIREIGELRGTSERTVRQQSLGIYSKAGVAGRAELSAYFMEDFLDRGFEDRPQFLE